MTLRLDELLGEARRALSEACFELPQPGREAARLAGHVLGLDEAQIRARDEQPVAEPEAERFRALVTRRVRGEPMAYLVGRREFWGRDFVVDRRVLVPRPETEHLVEAALDLDLPAAPQILDLGTGSGCLAITLALEKPDSRVVATDRSPAALAVCALNARRLGARVRCLAADLTAPLVLEGFDLVVSNPPYIDPAATLSPEVRDHEPGMALFADDRGRDMLRRLLDTAAALRPGVVMLLEIGHDQGEWLRSAVAQRPHLGWRRIHRDLAGIERTAEIERRSGG